ncbi:carbohydrate ABC transporter permease [Bifidobacterium scardovii]|uniref:Putative integral membrane transport protein n=1 Tax=Bifidobacterium scardovii TaxID=158787 RepID=A0A087DIY4_9BIFI|nr:sugar ABC transporter permease [Bifidobacterium scardovii]KFI95484.1 putative integral membrane transport protein [Bifidobacterium scardovii]MBS6947290.1 sugar ABC transporter permease [Bifidobacterium scardovii]MDK6348920.1 sugar ABC transporter permease [Bifidobacterium scardovii]MDU2422351.1 sugar ABC transporter permease [Bifidobacterium scardovii]MDU3735898.1 sugar ABC transporter permease [Bifidobacterium scardovii]
MSNAKSAAAVPTPAPAKRKGGHVSWRTLEALKGASFTWPFLAGFIFFVIIPVVMALQVSLYSKQKSGLGLGEATTKFVGLQNILNAMRDTTFWAGLGRVALYAVIVVPLTQILSMAIALLIDASSRKMAGRFRIFLLLPYMTPGIVATTIWIYLYSPSVGPLTPFFKAIGLNVNFFSSNMVWGSIGQMAIWGGLGFNMLIMYGSLQAIPGEVIEAARLDGASEFRIARSIKVPYMLTSVALTTMLNIIGTVQLFDQPFLFRSVSPQTITKDFTPAMMIYNQAFQVGNLNYATALSIVLAVIMGIASGIIYKLQNREK